MIHVYNFYTGDMSIDMQCKMWGKQNIGEVDVDSYRMACDLFGEEEVNEVVTETISEYARGRGDAIEKLVYVAATNEKVIIKWNVKKCGEMFDYDMQIKAKTDAKMAKMIRFFEYVTIEKNSLESKYQPLEEPVDLKNAQYLISDHTTISGSPMGEQLYKMKCPYDPSGICIAKADGVKPFDSEATLVMYSQLTYQILADQGLVNITSLLAANVSEETFGDFLRFIKEFWAN